MGSQGKDVTRSDDVGQVLSRASCIGLWQPTADVETSFLSTSSIRECLLTLKTTMECGRKIWLQYLSMQINIVSYESLLHVSISLVIFNSQKCFTLTPRKVYAISK